MRYPHAAEGLKLMFYGAILAIVGVVLVWIPILGLLIVLAGGIVNLVGLHKAGPDNADYRTAFIISIVNVVLNLLGLDIISSLLSLAVVYYVCKATNELLQSIGEEALVQRGHTVWKINLVCTIINVVVSALVLIEVLTGLAAIVAIVVLIVQIVGEILYMMYLSGSSKVL